MDGWTKESLAEFYPEGRTFYYEGDDPESFIKLARKKGWAITIPPASEPEWCVTAAVPAEELFDFYALGLRYGT